jgi:SAM-dependent MidA family methyltransferase
MGSSNDDAPSPAFLARFRRLAGATGRLRFDAFMHLALYDAEVGYYQRAQARVGRIPDRDFYTATSSGPLFGELITAAALDLLGGHPPGDFSFVEVGTEPAGGVLRGLESPFAQARELRLGEPLVMAGPTILFANELFDAQPFRRYLRTAAGWTESYVTASAGRLDEHYLPVEDPAGLPDHLPPNYQLDLSDAARDLARQLTAGTWPGLCLFFDYGRSREELFTHFPQGTARAYRRHQLSSNLLAHPGDQDLTCHVCWDDIGDTLAQAGFIVSPVQSQEAFLVHHAGSRLAEILAREGGRFSPVKQAVMQLIHPGNLGQKFQVMVARRGLSQK